MPSYHTESAARFITYSGEGQYAKVKIGVDEYRQQVAIKVFDKVMIFFVVHIAHLFLSLEHRCTDENK
jgi:transcriptional antiterminator